MNSKCFALTGLLICVCLASAQDTTDSKHRELTRLHQILRTQSNLHDEYFEAGEVGNEQTVPLLLNRLRSDYGAVEPIPQPGLLYGIDCAQDHLVSALTFITNTDQGMYYPQWSAWWARHGNLSQSDWILNGFNATGLRVAEPMDSTFAGELIEVIGTGKEYQKFNARRLLNAVDPQVRGEWIKEAAGSTSRSRRLGALLLLREDSAQENRGTLEMLADDIDPEIRMEALTLLYNIHPQQK